MRRGGLRVGAAGAVACLALAGSGTPVHALDLGPAAPVDLLATNTATSISVSWVQPATGIRPSSFRVYEGSTVVARNTTTHATIRNLVFGGSHTYTVTAVDRYGRESTPSTPVTRTAFIGGPHGCGHTPPSGLSATEVTASSVSLQWSNTVPYYDMLGTLLVYVDGAAVLQTTMDSARIGGLAPGSSHTFQVARRDCSGGLHPGPLLTISTVAGAAARPAAPAALTVGARTNSSVDLSWTAQPSADPTAVYAVYDGGLRVAVTSGTAVTVRGLWRDTAHVFTVAAVDAAGNESATSPPAATTTLPCDTPLPAPVRLTATPLSPSSVALSWVSTVEAASYTVFASNSNAPVATLPSESAMVTGLPSAATIGYTVVAQVPGCGSTPASAAATATTPAGPSARPNPVADLRATVGPPSLTDSTAPITFGWTPPASADPIAGYRLYEGSAVLASSPTAGLTLRLKSGPTHTVTVTAVDGAGNESAQSTPVTFTVPFIPPP
jgi:fibronectin type 3 domain-containing protein